MKITHALLAVAVALAGSTLGCTQVPPASAGFNANLTWSAASSCSTSGSTCTYAVYRETLAAGVTTCDPLTSNAWGQLNKGSEGTALSYTDATAGGLNACYVLETLQGGGNSAPSNTQQGQIPGAPTAPNLGPVTPVRQTANLSPMPQSEDAEVAGVHNLQLTISRAKR